MRLCLRAAVLVASTLLTLSVSQSPRPTQRVSGEGCAKEFTLSNAALRDTLQAYLKYVANNEIPILAVQDSADTTHYVISAFITTYSIRKNPPTALIKLINREALLYTGKASMAQMAPSCLQYILKKYTQLLDIDKLYRRKVIPSNKTGGFFYDPILKDIAVSKDGRITTKFPQRFPFITYD